MVARRAASVAGVPVGAGAVRLSTKAKLVWFALALVVLAVAYVTKSEWALLLWGAWTFSGLYLMSKYPDTQGD